MAFVAARPTASDGSRTITILDNQTREEGEQSTGDVGGESSVVGALRLRGARTGPRVVWSEDVVDNEHAGKKSSKVCCIYHKPRAFDESSSESDSSSDSDSDSDCCPDDHNHPPHSHRERSSRGPHPNADGAQLNRNQGSGGAVVHQLDGDDDEVNMYEQNPARQPKKGKKPARRN